MADISLDELLKSKGAQSATETVLEPQQEIVKVTEQTEMISPEDRQKIDKIKEQIDLTDSGMALQYGNTAQKNIADFSNNILTNVRGKDSGYVGDLMGQLLTKVKDFNVEGQSKKSFVKGLPVIGSLFSKGETLANSYTTLAVQVDKIQGELERAKMTMMKDVVMFDNLYNKNLEYFKLLQIYIQAGEEKIEDMKNVTLPKLRQEASVSTNPMANQVVNDFENAVERFEKKVHDLKISKVIAIQTAPQIRLIQNNDKALVDRVQSAIYNTIPLWKNQMVIALGLSRQKKVLEMQRAVSDTTNDLLKRNAEMLKQNSIETAKENERSIVDIETVKKVNDDLIATIEETVKIHQEGRMKRQAAEQELVQIEEKLKQTLMQNSQAR